MSADFTKVLVKDDRLDVVDNIKYAVLKGGQNMTCQQFVANSETPSSITFNIQVPSEQTIIDRRVLLQTRQSYTVISKKQWCDLSDNNQPKAGTITDINPSLTQSCGYGFTAGLAPFPTHQLMTTINSTINNNTVSINVKDTLPAMMRMLDKRDLANYNGTTPTYQDTYGFYPSKNEGAIQGGNNNSLRGYEVSPDTDIYTRGAFQPVAYTSRIVGTTVVETFDFIISEPIMLSPWIFGNCKSNSQGFYGIQNLTFLFNLDANNTRAFRGLSAPTDKISTPSLASPSPAKFCSDASHPDGDPFLISVKLETIKNSTLLFQFLTPHPSDLLPARNIVPFYELPRYPTKWTSMTPASLEHITNNYLLTPSVGQSYTSQSLQLNQIPDKLICYLRKASLGVSDPDRAYPINQIALNFNNASSLLNSARPEDLYRMALENGSNQNWIEFNGVANTIAAAGSDTQGFYGVPTVGSYIILEFGKDIQLVEDFYAPGSLGNFNLNVVASFNNNDEFAYNAGDLELIVITLNSGVFVNERGTSSTYTGILTKADVLEASEQVPYTRNDVRRMVGSGFLDSIKSAISKIAPIAKMVAPLLANSGNPYASTAGKVMGALTSGSGVGMGVGLGASGGMRLKNRLV